MTEVRDYLAVITNQFGGGSWARGADRADAIKRAARFYKKDWSHLFKVGKKGQVIKVNVIDVTGYDQIEWDDRGFWRTDPETKKLIALDRKVDIVEHTY